MNKIQSSTAQLTRLSEELNHSDWGRRVIILGALAAEAKLLAAKAERLLEDEFIAVGLPSPA